MSTLIDRQILLAEWYTTVRPRIMLRCHLSEAQAERYHAVYVGMVMHS